MFSIIEQFRTAFPDNVPVELYNHLSPWYMSNVRYYPCGLKDKVWDKGNELFKKWIDIWAYECIVYNAMMHSQDIFYIKEGKKCGFSFPKLNYQYMLGQEHLNGIALQEAHIIHCQATRGSKEAINKMKALIEE